jgi:2-oxoglutarate ferredoxin oxidoreductase subunit gamma
VISETEIDFPKVIQPDVLVVMSQHAYNEYADDIKPGGTMIIDSEMIPREKKLENVKIYRVPATKIADQLGRRIVANIVMLGAFVSITKLLDENSVKESIKENIPKGTEELNLAAFDKGFEYGQNLKA